MFATIAFAPEPFRTLDDLGALGSRRAAPPVVDDVDVDAADRTTAAELAAETAEARRVRACPGHGDHGPQVAVDDDAEARCWKCGCGLPEGAA